MSDSPILTIENLSVTFTGGAKPVRAVDGVDLTLNRGEVVALLDEKKTRLDGRIIVAGIDVTTLKGPALSNFRGKTVSMIFQEPMLAMDPVYTVGQQIIEAIRRHEPVSKADARQRALALFERVRIPSPDRRLDAYPHEMSGGMRQRAMIALALACHPQVLLADEPTTALDATVQVQILLLLRDLQRELSLSMIFVTHDISVGVEVADRIAVMYAGRVVEVGPVRDVIRTPRHPYTIGLLSTRTAHGGLAGKRLQSIPGSPPDVTNLPSGCAFAPRCAFAGDICRQSAPSPTALTPAHHVRCHRTDATVGGVAALAAATQTKAPL
jgi:peptide/nickel transport system ATP-binding protein